MYILDPFKSTRPLVHGRYLTGGGQGPFPGPLRADPPNVPLAHVWYLSQIPTLPSEFACASPLLPQPCSWCSKPINSSAALLRHTSCFLVQVLFPQSLRVPFPHLPITICYHLLIQQTLLEGLLPARLNSRVAAIKQTCPLGHLPSSRGRQKN